MCGGWDDDDSVHVATNISEVGTGGTGMEEWNHMEVESHRVGGTEMMESWVGEMGLLRDGGGRTDGWVEVRKEEAPMVEGEDRSFSPHLPPRSGTLSAATGSFGRWPSPSTWLGS